MRLSCCALRGRRLAAVAASCLAAFCADALAADIRLDPSKRFQTIEGWEVTLRGWEQDKVADRYDPTWLENSEEAVIRLVDEAGVNRVRLEVRSGAEAKTDTWRRFAQGEETYSSWAKIRYQNVNDNDDPYTIDPEGFFWSELDAKVEHFVLPMQARLAARGEKLYVNFCVVDFRKGGPGSLDLAGKPEEYAELVLASFLHLKSTYGVEPDSLEIMLEPENADGWTANRLGPAIVAAKNRLAKAGFHPAIIAPSTVSARRAAQYFRTARKAGADIDVLSYHSYDWPDDGVRADIERTARAAGASTAMLEHLKADVGEFHSDMTTANASAWQQWGMVGLKDDGNFLLVADLAKPEGARMRLSARAARLSQIWRHARIGDVRIRADTSAPELRPLAFLRPGGAVALAVIVDMPREISIEGLPPGDYALEVTTRPRRAEPAGVIRVGADGLARISMPEPGVAALVPAR